MSPVQAEGAPSNLHQPEPSQPVPISSVPELDEQEAAGPSPSPSPELVSQSEGPTLGDNGSIEEDRAAAPSNNLSNLDLSGPDLATQDTYTGTWEWNSAANLTTHQDLNWHHFTHRSAYGDASTLGIAAFASLLNQPMIGDRAVDGLSHAPISSSSQPLIVDNALRAGNGSLVESGTGVDLSFDPDFVISELSKLSARLSTIRRSCYNIVAALEGPTSACQGLQQPLLHQVNFKMACGWLAHGPDNMDNMDSPPNPPDPDTQSNGSESKEVGLLLHEVYTASNLLLEILRSMQSHLLSLTPAESNSTPSTTSSDNSYFHIHTGQVSPPLSVLPSLSVPFRQNLVTSDRNSPFEENDVIHHLVMACHTMLLTIYIAVLLVLERETDFSIRTNTLVLGDIR